MMSKIANIHRHPIFNFLKSNSPPLPSHDEDEDINWNFKWVTTLVLFAMTFYQRQNRVIFTNCLFTLSNQLQQILGKQAWTCYQTIPIRSCDASIGNRRVSGVDRWISNAFYDLKSFLLIWYVIGLLKSFDFFLSCTCNMVPPLDYYCEFDVQALFKNRCIYDCFSQRRRECSPSTVSSQGFHLDMVLSTSQSLPII